MQKSHRDASRHTGSPWQAMAGVALGLAVAVLVISFCGCQTATPPPCIPTIKEVPSPPETIYVVAPEAKVGPEPVIESLDWTEEMIAADPATYCEVLYADLAEVVGLWAANQFELRKINAAGARALLEGAVTEVPE